MRVREEVIKAAKHHHVSLKPLFVWDGTAFTNQVVGSSIYFYFRFINISVFFLSNCLQLICSFAVLDRLNFRHF